jgi:predicted dehydrogenase
MRKPVSGSTIDVALVGLGSVAESHLVAYQKLPGVRIVGVAEPRESRRNEICAKYQIHGFASLQELLAAAQPDVACILTPASTHRALTDKCAAAGVHVLCEKPMALSASEAIAMRDACEREGVKFCYGSSYRYLPAVRAAKSLIASGIVGSVRLITESFIGGEGAARYRALSPAHYPEGGPGGGGYGLVDHGIHMLDILPWLCGSSLQSVFGRGDRTGEPARAEFAILRMESGCTGMLTYDGSTWPAELPAEGLFSSAQQWVAGRGWVGDAHLWDATPGNIKVYGSAGSLRIYHYANRLFVSDEAGVREQPLRDETTPWHFGAQLQDFWRVLASDESPPTSAADGILAMRALEALYASELSGHWESVDSR